MVGYQFRFFYPPAPASGRHGGAGASGKPGRRISIGELYGVLIRAGYGRTPAEIGRYTWRQLQLFFQVEERASRRNRRSRLVDTNAAFAGGRPAKTLERELGD